MITKFENYDYYLETGGNKDEYIESPEYFIEIYYNNQFEKLKKLLKEFKLNNKIDKLLSYIDETVGRTDRLEMKNWIETNL